jgi:hypothetical protein
VLTLQRWLERKGPAVEVQSVCPEPRCGRSFLHPFKPPADQVVEEHRLPSGRVADVAVLRDGVPIAIVEIFATHAVDDQKAVDLGGLPCAELDAEAALRSPLLWDPNPNRRKHPRLPGLRSDSQGSIRSRPAPTCGSPSFGATRTATRSSAAWARSSCVEMRGAPRGWAFARPTICVRIARLNQEVTRVDWEKRGRDRRRWVDQQADRFPKLPDFVRVYWAVEAALKVHGGEWVTPPTTPWTGRHDDTTPPETDESRWARLRRVAARTGQRLPEGPQSPYWAETGRCFRDTCGEES